jgi:hypothetical protein
MDSWDYDRRRAETLAILDKRAELKRKHELDLQTLKNIPDIGRNAVDKQLVDWKVSPTRQREQLAVIDAQNKPAMTKLGYDTSRLAQQRALELERARQAPNMLEAETMAKYSELLAKPSDLTNSVRGALGIGSNANIDTATQTPSVPSPAAPKSAVDAAFTPTLLGPIPNVSSLATPMIFNQAAQQENKDVIRKKNRNRVFQNQLVSFATPMS